jgi:hypothetical protein
MHAVFKRETLEPGAADHPLGQNRASPSRVVGPRGRLGGVDMSWETFPFETVQQVDVEDHATTPTHPPAALWSRAFSIGTRSSVTCGPCSRSTKRQRRYNDNACVDGGVRGLYAQGVLS